MSNKKNEFWITNVSKRLVNIHDLGLFIKPHASINLLDKKHYFYTLDQIESSVKNGSIYSKRDKIFVRKFSPDDFNQEDKLKFDNNSTIPSRERSAFTVKEEVYEELLVSDEEFADENSDLEVELMNKTTIKGT